MKTAMNPIMIFGICFAFIGIIIIAIASKKVRDTWLNRVIVFVVLVAWVIVGLLIFQTGDRIRVNDRSLLKEEIELITSGRDYATFTTAEKNLILYLTVRYPNMSATELDGYEELILQYGAQYNVEMYPHDNSLDQARTELIEKRKSQQGISVPEK